VKDHIGIGLSFLLAGATQTYKAANNSYTVKIKQYQLGISTIDHLFTTGKMAPG
jgi:hypothetical protein